MIEIAVLGLLKEQPMHGYQLSQELADQQGGLFRVSFGSLYPTLRRLERDGAIERDASDRTGGRRKTVYRITPEGERLFLEWLAEPQDDQAEDTRFRLRVAFFRYLPPETRVRLLERRRTRLEQRLEQRRDRGLAEKADAEGGHRDPELAGSQIAVDLIELAEHRVGTPGALGCQRLDPPAAGSDQSELSGDEEAVEQHEGQQRN